MSSIESLHNRIDLARIPFTDRGSRLMLFRRDGELCIRLSERWEKMQGKVGHYRQRPPIVDHFALLDMNDQPLSFEVESYPHLVRLHTSVGVFEWAFLDPETILLHLPPGQYGFRFNVSAESGQIERRGGVLRGVRNVAYTTNARRLRNEMTLLPDGAYQVTLTVEAGQGKALALNITPRLGFNHSVPDPAVEIAACRQRWDQWFQAVPPVLDEYRPQYDYAWWVMRAGLLNQRFYFTRESLVPSKIHYVGVWHWDQFFHAIAYRHVDARLAEDQIRIVLDHQREDGMLPDAIHDEGLVTHLTAPVDADVTKPPLAAWAALKLFEKSQHEDFLEEIYEPLTRWHNWWVKYNTDENGLCVYRHPFSSGLDDSPLWDFGMPVASPDLNTYLFTQQESLAAIAEYIGRPDDAAQYREGAAQLIERMLEVMWSESHGLFMAIHNGEFIPVITPFNLLPLWTNRLPDTVKNRLLNHLTDPRAFWTQYPLATVSVSDPTFSPVQMWRGPTWVNVNYLFTEALTRIGETRLARDLRRKTLQMVMLHPDIYEYYNPLTGEHPPKAAPMYGWSAALFIDMAIEETRLSRT